MRPYGPSYQGFGSYGAYGGIGGYGGYHNGYRPYGGPYGGYEYNSYGDDDSRFIRQAEESTRTAFQSVESVVGAFASMVTIFQRSEVTRREISALQRTFSDSCSYINDVGIYIFCCAQLFQGCVGSSTAFHEAEEPPVECCQCYITFEETAVLVEKNFEDAPPKAGIKFREYKFTECIGKLFGTFPADRTMVADCLKKEEEMWEEVALQNPNLTVDSAVARDRRLWPVVMFFVMVFGVPWLLWKLLSSFLQREDSNSAENTWTNGDGQPVIARALYDFNSERSGELSFSAGDELVLAPKQLHNDWLLAGRNRRSGLVPANYLQILPPGAQRSGNESRPPTPTPSPQGLLHDEENLLND